MRGRCSYQARRFTLFVGPVEVRVKEHLFFQRPRVCCVKVFDVVLHLGLCALGCFAGCLAVLAGS